MKRIEVVELTDEERRKIYEEEKARLEAQEKLKKEKKSGCLLPGIFIIIILLLLLAIFGPHRCKDKGSDSVRMNPTVIYRGNLLIIKNNDSFGYDSIKVTLNDTFHKELPLSIPPGEEGCYELSDFVKSDGERFNIFKYSPTEISITCESPGLNKLFYHAKFK